MYKELPFSYKEFLPEPTIDIKIGSWETHNLERSIVLPETIQAQAIEVVNRWVGVFPKEDTWIQTNFGIPSLIIRIDGVEREGALGIYEIEDRPAGIGHSILLNPQFKDKLAAIKPTWPDFDVVVSPLRDKADDLVWNNVVDFESARGSERPIFVRAEPEEEQFRVFQSRSVSTIATEGDKSYGIALGLWSFINDPKQFPKHRSFVLKPLQGSKGRNMAFYDVKGNPRPGTMKMKNVIKVLDGQVQERGGMYIQELIPPMDSGVETHPFMIYRFFLGFNCVSREWVSLGGSYFLRNNLKIHGHSDSLSGPLVIK